MKDTHNTQHTPGPWTWTYPEGWESCSYNRTLPSIEGVMDFGNCCYYAPQEGTPPNEANARLIAAAPELLNALESLLIRLEDNMDWYPEDEEEARAAINAATGEPS